MSRAIKFGAWTGVNDIHPSTIDQVYRKQQCLSCLVGKINHLPRENGSGIRPNIFGQAASVDWVPVNPVSIAGHIGFYMFSEASVDLKFGVLSKTHDSEHLITAVNLFVSHLKQFKHTLRYLRYDAGKVENAAEVTTALNDLNITTDPAAPESQFQNPAERNYQTVMKGVAAMFAGQEHMRENYWNIALLAYLAADTACPNSVSGEFSPEFHLTGRHPDLAKRFQFKFGQPVVSVILKDQKSKFAFGPRGEFAQV